jgi:hypothetical protein
MKVIPKSVEFQAASLQRLRPEIRARGGLREGELDNERRSLILLALHGHTASVFVYDFGRDGQAQTYPAGLCCEERIKNLFPVLRPDPAAAVDHRNLQAGAQCAGLHGYHSVGRRSIGGILNQVKKHTLEQRRVALHGGQ